MLVRARDPELDHGRPEVVQVLVQARLGVHAHDEVLDALGRHRRRLDPQRVQIVRDRAAVAVLGQVADGEVHADDGPRGGLRGVAKVAAGDVGIDEAELPLDDLERGRDRAVDHRRARAEVEVGHQPRQPQDGGRAAVGRVGGGQRVVQRLDREGHAVRVVALEQQEAGDGARVGRRGHGAPVGLEAADGLQQRERLAVEDVRLRLRAVGGQRDAQHPQDHVGRLDRGARLQERVGLVAQHRPAGHAPEQAAALAHVRVDASTGRSGRRRRCCAAAGRGGRC